MAIPLPVCGFLSGLWEAVIDETKELPRTGRGRNSADDPLGQRFGCGEEKDMKLIYAIVRNDNEDDVTTALSRAGYSITKLNTTGGFLRKGNVTLMIGTDDEKVDQAIGIIKKECGESQKITIDMPFISGVNMVNYATMPMQVAVGGATIFVTDVVRFEKF